MIWNLATMGRVRSRYTQGDLADEQNAASHGMAEMHLKQLMAERLKQDCHPLGVEIDLRDVGFQVRPSSVPNATRYRARWAPMHGLVELLHGPRDGEVLEVAPQLIDWSAPITFATLDAGPVWDAETAVEPVPIAHLEYRLHGYHEETRAWVYKFYL